MEDIVLKYKNLENSLHNTLNKSKSEWLAIVENTVQTLWNNYTSTEILKIPKFYEFQVNSIPKLSQDEFLKSLKEKNVLQEIIDSLSLVELDYRGYNNKIYTGQMIIHKDLVESTKLIFKRILKETDFPITSIIPLSFYNWDKSLAYNNSSWFDWRFVYGTDEITDHAFGAAIDLNPLINPRIGGTTHNTKSYNPNQKGTLFPSEPVVKIFKEAGWKWWWDWKRSKDYQHFYRPKLPFKYYGKVEIDE